MVSVKGHVTSNFVKKSNFSNKKIPRKVPCLSGDAKLDSITEYKPQPFSASIHKYVLTHI